MLDDNYRKVPVVEVDAAPAPMISFNVPALTEPSSKLEKFVSAGGALIMGGVADKRKLLAINLPTIR